MINDEERKTKERKYGFEEVVEIIKINSKFDRVTEKCLRVVGEDNANVSDDFFREINSYGAELRKYPEFFAVYETQFKK